MSDYLNEKYGEGTCSADDLEVGQWFALNTNPYLCFRGQYMDNYTKVAKKEVYMIFLSPWEVVFLDTFQWDEISEDLEAEAAAMTGLEEVCMDKAALSRTEFGEIYYYCPWLHSGGYITKYEGDLEGFFREEKKAREALSGSGITEEYGGINGAAALYFADPVTEDLRSRLENPQADYEKQYENALRKLEKKYDLTILSCVMIRDHYESIVQAVEAEEHGVWPTEYKDYGPGQVFYNPAYTLLSYSYGEMKRPEAEKAAEGIHVVSPEGKEWLADYAYSERETQEEVLSLIRAQVPDWKAAQSFDFERREDVERITGIQCTVIIDAETLYPEAETGAAHNDYNGWELHQEAPACPAGTFSSGVFSRWDGFLVLNITGAYPDYTILIK